MEYEHAMEEQVRHVRAQAWDIEITDRQPVKVTISDVEYERTYTVKPWLLECSCTGQGEVDMFCDHLIALLDHDGFAGALVREYLKERRNALFKQMSQAEDITEATAQKRRRITAVLNAVDADHSMARTRVDCERMLKAMAGVENKTEDNELEQHPTPDKNRVAFEAMVKQVRIDEEAGIQFD